MNKQILKCVRCDNVTKKFYKTKEIRYKKEIIENQVTKRMEETITEKKIKILLKLCKNCFRKVEQPTKIIYVT